MAEYGSAADAGKRQLSDVAAPKRAVEDNSEAAEIAAITSLLGTATQAVNTADARIKYDKKEGRIAAANELEAKRKEIDGKYSKALQDINQARSTGQISETTARTLMIKEGNAIIESSGGIWGNDDMDRVATKAANSPLGTYLAEKTDAEQREKKLLDDTIAEGYANINDPPDVQAMGMARRQVVKARASELEALRNSVDYSKLSQEQIDIKEKEILTKGADIFISDAEATLVNRLGAIGEEIEEGFGDPMIFNKAKQKLTTLVFEFDRNLAKLTPKDGLSKNIEARVKALKDVVSHYQGMTSADQWQTDFDFAQNYITSEEDRKLLEQYPDLAKAMQISRLFPDSPAVDVKVGEQVAGVLNQMHKNKEAAAKGMEELHGIFNNLSEGGNAKEVLTSLTNYVVKGSEVNPYTSEEFVPEEERLGILSGTLHSVIETYGNNNPKDRGYLINWLGSQGMGDFVRENINKLPEDLKAEVGDLMTRDLSETVFPEFRNILEQHFKEDPRGWQIFSGDVEHVKLGFSGGKALLVPSSNKYNTSDLRRVNEKISPILSGYVRASSNLSGTPAHEILADLQPLLHPEAAFVEEKTQKLVEKYGQVQARLSQVSDPAQRTAIKRGELAPLGDQIRSRPNMENWEWKEPTKFDPKSLEGKSQEELKARLEELKSKRGG